MPKYLIARRMIVEERYRVEAPSAEAAEELGMEGEVDNRVADESEWVDYLDEHWQTVAVTDDLMDFLNSKDTA